VTYQKNTQGELNFNNLWEKYSFNEPSLMLIVQLLSLFLMNV